MSQKAEYTWKDTGSEELLVAVRGEIDHHTAVSIRTGIDARLFERRPSRLILDLSAVTFMDSSGLGLIMGRFGVMRELGGSVCVRDPSPETRSILTLAGMERMVQIEYTHGAAVRTPAREDSVPCSGRVDSRHGGCSRSRATGAQGRAVGSRQRRRKAI